MYDYDPYDTPPAWLRLVMLAICLAGALLVLVWTLSHSAAERAVIALGGLLGAAVFIFSARTGVAAAGWAVGYWALLIVLMLSMPIPAQ